MRCPIWTTANIAISPIGARASGGPLRAKRPDCCAVVGVPEHCRSCASPLTRPQIDTRHVSLTNRSFRIPDLACVPTAAFPIPPVEFVDLSHGRFRVADPGARGRHPDRLAGAARRRAQAHHGILPERGEPVQRRPCPVVRRRVRPLDRRDRVESARRARQSPRPDRQCAGRGGAPARQGRRHRGRRAGPAAVAPARRGRPGRHRQDQEPGASACDIRPRRHRRAGDRHVDPARRPRGRAHGCGKSRGAAVRGRLLHAGRPGRERRRAGREGRAAFRHSAAAVSRSPAQGDRGGSAAAVLRGAARDASGDPTRAGEGLRRARRQGGGARLLGRPAHASRRCARRAGSTRRRWSSSPRPGNTRKPSRRWPACAPCRSRWWIG